MKKIITVLGARPQFIKAAVISRILKENYSNSLNEVIVHTGQHFDQNMSDIFFDEMQIPKPNFNLSVGGKSHGEMTGEMLFKLEKIMVKEKPELVLVYGDTNSTLAGALSASKLNIPVAHVESGLRSFNKNMPEEINRILTDHISTFLFCPTENAVKNLGNEGIKTNVKTKVVKTGDIMYDSCLFYKKLARPSLNIKQFLNKPIFLATIHRQENTDNPSKILSLINTLDEISNYKKVVFPLHPRTKKVLENYGITPKNISIIDPVGYFEMICLLNNSDLVFTDSGGLQKEAYFFGKPCIILREETEWVELIENKLAVLVGTDRKKILEGVENFKNKMIPKLNLYGDGNTGEQIVRELLIASTI